MSSPIETKLVAAIRANLKPRSLLWDYTAQAATALRNPNAGWSVTHEHQPVTFGADREDLGARAFGARAFVLSSQVQFESYRADLVIESGFGLILIECDGHEWHERTKQQAAYDRERDRWFMAQGLMTARFTGSEIVHYAERCCVDLFAILDTACRIGEALCKNGFNTDGRSYYADPTSIRGSHGDGREFEQHWNPGRVGD